ncbi:MBL fold metallo-hydrolase [Candidatus Bipolaricaulota bacterium]|nr:MBL fold metallo-hydrolase [Candidatus Bipolaricaulota bacterium]
MKITWVGHACFLLEAPEATVLTDPFNAAVPYPSFPEQPVNVVTISHDHADHNAIDRVTGQPIAVRTPGEQMAHGVSFRGIPSFHDDIQGAARGRNLLFRFELDGVRIAHLGDVGVPLSAEQIAALDDVELLFIPVGGHYTIGPKQAAAIVKSLPAVRLVIPMHFRTDVLADWPIGPVEDFARTMDNVRQIGTSAVSLDRGTLPETLEVWILNYA